MVLLNNFILLVDNLKEHVKLDQIEIICNLVECSVTVAALQKKEIHLQDESGNEDDRGDIPEELSSVFERLSESVANVIKWKPRYRCENKKDAQWHQELQVSNCRYF